MNELYVTILAILTAAITSYVLSLFNQTDLISRSEMDRTERRHLERIGELQGLIQFWIRQYQTIAVELEQLRQNSIGNQVMINSMTPPPIELIVLGIWADQPDLNLQASADVLYNSGVEYIPLQGDDIDRRRVIDEFGNGSFNAIEIGTHGKRLEMDAKGATGGVRLADGWTPPGFWQRLAQIRIDSGKPLELAVILACNSIETGRAMMQAGVKYVIVVQDEIRDVDAVHFSFLFYKFIAQGRTIESAFELSQLSLPRIDADNIRLLTND